MAKSYSKSDLINDVMKKTKTDRKTTKNVVETALESLQNGLKKNGRVSISGFGTFSTRKTKAQKGGQKKINPFTGEEYTTKAKPSQTKVKFRPAQAFKGMFK